MSQQFVLDSAEKFLCAGFGLLRHLRSADRPTGAGWPHSHIWWLAGYWPGSPPCGHSIHFRLISNLGNISREKEQKQQAFSVVGSKCAQVTSDLLVKATHLDKIWFKVWGKKTPTPWWERLQKCVDSFRSNIGI